jgi:DNA invertase Pin-like site-specific DNA recombinase
MSPVAERVAIYARISSDREMDGLAIDRQLADCERYAELHGWRVSERYIDQDVSAYASKVRPAYRRMLGDLRSGTIDGVIVYHLDRLHRQPRELEEFFDVCKAAGVDDLATVTGRIDLADPDGQFQARILGAVAAKESANTSRRIRRKNDERAAAGKVAGGGTRAYGYAEDKKTIRPGEAAVIRDAATRLLAGESIRSICITLNERGEPTATGKQWTSQTLTRMLKSPRISGQRVHRGEILGPAEWPGIITPAETERIQALLADPSRRTAKTARSYLLARLLRCGRCGATLVSRRTAKGTRRYVCASGPGFGGCGRIAINADHIEHAVVEATLFRLDSPKLLASLQRRTDDPAAAEWQAEAERAEAKMDELSAAYANDEIGMREWLTARAGIEQRVQVARKKLATLNRVTALDGYLGNATELRAEWPSMPLSRQAAIIAAVLDHAVIAPATPGRNTLDPSRISFVWRG